VPQRRAAVGSPVPEESVVLDRPAGAARLMVDPQRPDERDGGPVRPLLCTVGS
jgi:hypothetical protein